MFTGIIEHTGRIASIERDSSGGRVRVDAGTLGESLALSGSVAVNGCCLTVVALSCNVFDADLSSETLRCTALGEMKAGAVVNLERPLTAGKELGGHFVQGHVDAVGRVLSLSQEGANWWLGVAIPASIEHYVAAKGSIAIDGISLTVASLRDGMVEAAIIPYTYLHTNLQALAPGAAVNLEVDILAKYVERLTARRSATSGSRVSLERLSQEGF